MIIEKLKDNPWRFVVGDYVYVAGWEQLPAKITAALPCKSKMFEGVVALADWWLNTLASNPAFSIAVIKRSVMVCSS